MLPVLLSVLPGATAFAHDLVPPEEEVLVDEDSSMDPVLYPSYETVVEGTRRPLAATHQHVDGERIERKRPRSSSEALEILSGVRVVQHGAEGKGHQLFLRGFDAAHGSDVEVLLEGVPLNEPLNVHGHGYLDLYGILPEVIGEMEISRGPFRAFQGDFATAGTVELRLEMPEEDGRGLVRTEVGHRGRVRGAAVWGTDEADGRSFLAGEAVYDAGFGPDREARRASLVGRHVFEVGPGQEVSVLLLGNSARFQSPGTVRLTDWTGGEMGFYDTYGQPGFGISDRAILRAGWSRRGSGTDLELFTYGGARRFGLEENFTGWMGDPANGDRRKQLMDSGMAGARMNVAQKVPVDVPLEITGGAGWQLDRAAQQEIRVTEGQAQLENLRDLEATRQHLDLQLGVRWSPVIWMELVPSARLDLFHYSVVDHRIVDGPARDTLFNVSPRLATVFPVHQVLTLFAAYGRGFRSPEARSITARGDGSVEDQTLAQYDGGTAEVSASDSVEVGVSVEPSAKLGVHLAGFATWLSSEIVFDHVSNLNLEKSSTRRLGVEVLARIEPLPWISADADLTMVDARFVDSGEFIPGTARWQGSAALLVGSVKGPRVGGELSWTGERQLAHGATVDGLVMLDLFAGWRFEAFDVAVMVDNATAARAMEGAYHYASWFDRETPRSAIPVIHYAAARPLTVRLMLTAYL